MGQEPFFKRIVKRIRTLCLTRTSRSARITAVLLEQLEERCVPAALVLVAPPSSLGSIESLPTIEEQPTSDDDAQDWSTPAAIAISDQVFGDADPANTTSVDSIHLAGVSSEAWNLGGGTWGQRLKDAPTVEDSVAGMNPVGPATAALANGESHSEASPVVHVAVSSVQRPAPPAQSAPAANLPAVVRPSLLEGTTLRLTRAQGNEVDVSAHYTITSFSNMGASTHEGAITLPAGVAHTEIQAPSTASETEIVTVVLKDGRNGQPLQPAVTLFLKGDPRACSERALLEAYQEGNSPEAFDALVERNRTQVLRTCYQIVGNWHDAEDVSQMVFLTLAQAQVRIQTGLAGWLRTVARNASLLLIRSTTRRNRHEQRAARPAVLAEDTSHEQREELDIALQQIAEPVREAVRLRYLEGWSQHEAAEIVGCPRGTLSQRAALGIRQLRGILSQDL